MTHIMKGMNKIIYKDQKELCYNRVIEKRGELQLINLKINDKEKNDNNDNKHKYQQK